MVGKYRGRPWHWYLGIPCYAFNRGIRAPWQRFWREWQARICKAQYGEDRILAAQFRRRHGFCVEVGANDGLRGSNTFYFEKIGWQGILIEPDPDVAAQCRHNRPSFQTVQAAVIAPGGPETVPFFVTADSTRSSLGFDTPTQQDVPHVFSTHAIQVPAKTLDCILDEAQATHVDFVTIDVEGHEWNVLQGFSLERWQPSFVIIERNAPEIDRRILAYLNQHGYHYQRTTPPDALDGNDWFARSVPRILQAA